MSPVPPIPEALTGAFLEDLCDKLKVLGEERQVFKSDVLSNARGWQRRHSIPELQLPKQQMRTELGSLIDATWQLKEQLEAVSEDLWEIMYKACKHFDADPLMSKIDYDVYNYDYRDHMGRPNPVITAQNHPDPATNISISELKDVLLTLMESAEVTALVAAQAKRGPQQDWPLEQWVFYMRNLWGGTLQRKFTRDVAADGSPISDAAIMCVEIYAKMDPATPPSRVLNEMKKLIHSHNQYLKRKRNPEIRD